MAILDGTTTGRVPGYDILENQLLAQTSLKSHFSHKPNEMGASAQEIENVKNGDPRFSMTPGWVPSYGVLESSQLTQTSWKRHFTDQPNEMGAGEQEGGNIRYGYPRFGTTAGWMPGTGTGSLESQQLAQSSLARHFMHKPEEDAKKRRMESNDSVEGSSSQNTETSEPKELDLELKL